MQESAKKRVEHSAVAEAASKLDGKSSLHSDEAGTFDGPAVVVRNIMERFAELMSAIWRQVGRSTRLDRALAEMAPAAFAGLQVGRVLVRRFDTQHNLVETAGTGGCRESATTLEARTLLSLERFAELRAWCGQGRLEHFGPSSAQAGIAGLLPDGLRGDVLVGPLSHERGPIGLVIFVAVADEIFDARHERGLRLLLEPFSAWLEHDQREHQLNAEREAAQAEKRALLSRLGRTDISESIIGEATGLREIMQRVEQVCRTDVPVLILGETGSGKEVVARRIHDRSSRAAGPFLRVNCGAIPPELVDSELFGHERGSFTGATAQRKGWFERADGGTLLLDECGELSLAAQVRLLRILQDGTYERVGGQQPLHVNVRIVAATHRDLAAMITQGAFREDLWYRMSVFPLRLPPLRDRLEDIGEMAAHFASKAAQRVGVALLQPSDDDVRLLKTYDWPGNVRELAAVIERAVILGEGKRLRVAKALGCDVVTNRPTAVADPANGPAALASDEFLSLDAAMVRHIEAALTRCHGRIEGPFGAARLLDVNPHTLRGRMRTLGIQWRQFRQRVTSAPPGA